MSKRVAVLDACIFYPAPLRDLFMQLSVSDLFQAKWTREIHAEWIYSLSKKRPDLKKENLEYIANLMDQHTRDCIVEDYQHIIPNLELPDPNDRHVLAAAIRSNSDTIVTLNLQDFPTKLIRKHDIVAKHPDDFILDLISINANAVYNAAKTHRLRLRNPPKNVDEYLATMKKQSLTNTINLFEQNKSLI